MSTTAVSPHQAAQDIEQYIDQRSGPYSAWYCGVATDPEARLFTDHGVNKQGDAWIFRGCANDTEARQVEDYFLKKGCKGAPGGGDRNSRFVYAYRMNSHTRP